MTSQRDAAIQELRTKYKVAETAHLHAVRAITDVIARGGTPSRELLDNEAKTARSLNEARSTLLRTMAAG